MQSVVKESYFDFKKFQKLVVNKVGRQPLLQVEKESKVWRVLIQRIIDNEVENPEKMQLCTVFKLCDWMDISISEFIN